MNSTLKTFGSVAAIGVTMYGLVEVLGGKRGRSKAKEKRLQEELDVVVEKLKILKANCEHLVEYSRMDKDVGITCGIAVAKFCRAPSDTARDIQARFQLAKGSVRQKLEVKQRELDASGVVSNTSREHCAPTSRAELGAHTSSRTDTRIPAVYQNIFEAVHYIRHHSLPAAYTLPEYWFYYEPVLMSALSLVEREGMDAAKEMAGNLDGLYEAALNSLAQEGSSAKHRWDDLESARPQRQINKTTIAKVRTILDNRREGGIFSRFTLLDPNNRDDAVGIKWLDARAQHTPEMILAEAGAHQNKLRELREACRAVVSPDVPAVELGVECGLWVAAARRAGREDTPEYQAVRRAFDPIPIVLVDAFGAAVEKGFEDPTGRALLEEVLSAPENFTLAAPIGLAERYLVYAETTSAPPLWSSLLTALVAAVPSDRLQECGVRFEEAVGRIESERVKLVSARELLTTTEGESRMDRILSPYVVRRDRTNRI